MTKQVDKLILFDKYVTETLESDNFIDVEFGT